MDVVRCIDDELDESLTLEYKDEQADNKDIVKELVAFCNARGRTLILGLEKTMAKLKRFKKFLNIQNGKKPSTKLSVLM
jgi:predicted HTH transcriptional regulator